MRCLWLAAILVVALGAAADSAQGGWEPYANANRTSPGVVWQWGYGQNGYGWYPAYGDWRTPGNANKISPNGVWWRGYGRFGYGWYSIYGNYVGNDYSTINYGYVNRASGFNFNRTDNYGFYGPGSNVYRTR